MPAVKVNDNSPPNPEPGLLSGPQAAPVHRWPVRVYYEDTDAGGVVYHAGYLRYCERARTEWLRERGLTQGELLRHSQQAFVVMRLEADFLAGAELDDYLTVASRIETLGRASMIFHQRVLRGDTPLFDCRVTIACVDMARRRPCRLPPQIAPNTSRESA